MSQFFDQASLVMVPSGYKDGKVYSQKPLSTDGELTFTRASSATRVGPDGLIEKVRTNLVLYSEQFDNGYWAKVAATATADATTAPDGTTTADKIVATATSGNHFIRTTATLTGEFTFSVFAKASEYTNLKLQDVNAGVYNCTYDLSSGTASGTGASIQSVGSGWYRCSVTYTSSGSTVSNSLIGAPSTSINYTGDGTSGIFAWGAMLETGVLTPHIATTTAAVSVGPVANLPRLDYLNSSCPRLLLEPTATALNHFSESFDNAYWTKNGTTATANEVTSPDGYQNADLIAATSAIGNRVERTGFSLTGAHTFSIFLKKGTSTRNLWYDGVKGVQIDWAVNGTPTVTGFSGGAPESFGYDDYGNGWYRVWFKDTYSGTRSIQLFPDRIGTTGDVYAWGANLTATAYLQSYIPTLGAAVTRTEDISKAIYNPIAGLTEATLMVEYTQTIARPSGLNHIAGYRDNANADFYILQIGNSDSHELRWRGQNGTAASLAINIPEATYGLNRKVAFVKTNDKLIGYCNGVKLAEVSDGTTDAFSTHTSEELDLWYSGFVETKKIKQLLLFPTALSDAQAIELTTL